MSEKKKPTRTSDADPGPERIHDPPAGLDRLRWALDRIVRVSKEAIGKEAQQTKAKGRQSPHAG